MYNCSERTEMNLLSKHSKLNELQIGLVNGEANLWNESAEETTDTLSQHFGNELSSPRAL